MEAEDVAIAMALTSTKHNFIVNDSEVAITNTACGRISQSALNVRAQSQELHGKLGCANRDKDTKTGQDQAQTHN